MVRTRESMRVRALWPSLYHRKSPLGTTSTIPESYRVNVPQNFAPMCRSDASASLQNFVL